MGTLPGLPVHGVIDIQEGKEISFGIGDLDSAVLAPRPNLVPGMQVVQLTITSSCLPESTRDVSRGLEYGALEIVETESTERMNFKRI